MILRGGAANKARPRFWRSVGIPVATPGTGVKAGSQDWTRAVIVVCLVGAALLVFVRRGLWPWQRRVFSPQEKQFSSLTDQTKVIEEIYATQRAAEREALGKLGSGAFSSSPWKVGDLQQQGPVVWDFFQPSYNCPSRELVGRPGEGRSPQVWLCGVRTLLQDPACIIYSFGASAGGSFEKALRSQTRCKVHVFDPLLSFQQQLEVERVGAISFLGYGIGPADGTVYLVDPRQGNPATNISHFQAKSLPSIMLDLQHEWVDLVVLDIQGMEWSVIYSWLSAYKSGLLPFSQLSVKLHWWPESKLSKGAGFMLGVLDSLLAANMRPFAAATTFSAADSAPSVASYSFVQVGSDGRYIMPEDTGTPSMS